MGEREDRENGIYEYNFGCLPPLPNGYRVVWLENTEMYIWMKEDEDLDGPICASPHYARRCAIAHFEHQKDQPHD